MGSGKRKRGKISQSTKTAKVLKKDLVTAVLCNKSTRKCDFCKMSRPPELSLLGSCDLYSLGTTVIHYFCILFSTEGKQEGEDEEGLFGFLLSSIQSEQERGRKLNCKYCKKSGATISCQAKSCKACYHFPCGVKAGCLYQYTGSYTSYCRTHRDSQALDKNNISKELDCVVCFESVAKSVRDPGRLACPGCGRNFHTTCLQRMALASGSECFKCPHCNNSDKFLTGMRLGGIYVPDKDADWEGEENSVFYNYGDLYRQAKKCSAVACVAKDREEHKLGTKWEIILCDFCGLNGVHIECEDLDIHKPDFSCSDCKEPLAKLARQDRVTCLAYNVDNCVVKLGRLPENTPNCVIRAGQKGKKEIFRRLSSKVKKFRDANDVVMVSCLSCNLTVPWMFLHHMEHHLDNCRQDQESLCSKYPSFISISRDESLGRTSYKCFKCDKIFEYQTWFEKHLKIVHEWQNTRKPSPPPLNVPEDLSENETPDDDDSSSSEDDEVIRAIIQKSQLKSDVNNVRNLYNPSLKFDLAELELSLTMAQFAKSDKYQLVVFIGDLSQEERNVVFHLWKHLDSQIGIGNTLKCVQCGKYFAERWQLSSHLSNTCSKLFEEFFNLIFPTFEKLKMVSEFKFYKEKVFSFLGQEYCLLCGRFQLAKNLNLDDTPAKKSQESGSLQNHLINFHFKKGLLLESGSQAPVYSCKILNCNSTFPSCPPFLHHMAETHGRVNHLLQECTSLSDLPGTQTLKDYANPFTQERHTCNICGKKAISKASLLIHMVEHNMVSDTMGLKCDQKNCDFHARFSEMSVARHFGLKHLHLPRSDAEIVDLESSDEEEEMHCVKTVEASSRESTEKIDIVKSNSHEEVIDEAATEGSDTAIKILESCSIDVSQFNSNLVTAPASLKPLVKETDSPVIVLDDSDDDDDMPIIRFKKIPVPLKGSYVCPFCTSGYREEATLLAHLVSCHFREKLAFMVTGLESPFACPKHNCNFRHKTKEGVGDHLGRRHRDVVITLVRQVFPDFSFSKHDSGDGTKADDDIIIDDEIVVLGESSQVKNAEFVSCEVVAGVSKSANNHPVDTGGVKARVRPVVLPSRSSMDLANSHHARIAPMVQQSNGSVPDRVKKSL